MPCLLALIGFFFPRLVMVVLWLSGYMGRAFQTALWPLLGFFFAPFTTLAYAIGMNSNGGHIDGIYVILLIVAVLLDIGVIGGGGRQARMRRRMRVEEIRG
jgi:hypothetical protein